MAGENGKNEMDVGLVRLLRAEVFVIENEIRSHQEDLKAAKQDLKKKLKMLFGAIDGETEERVSEKTGEIKQS